MPVRRLNSASGRLGSPTAKASISDSARVTAVTPPAAASSSTAGEGDFLAVLRILDSVARYETALYAVQRVSKVPSTVRSHPRRHPSTGDNMHITRRAALGLALA